MPKTTRTLLTIDSLLFGEFIDFILSLGSIVKLLSCGGIFDQNFNDHFIVNFLFSVPVKEF